MNTTTSSKSTGQGTLPKRDPKTGRFEKATAKAAATAKPAAAKAKAATTAKPAAAKGKKP